jgi:hypothetical protein
VTHTDVVVIKRGPNAGSRFRLNQPVRSAGRAPDSNVFLDDINRQPPSRRVPARKRRALGSRRRQPQRHMRQRGADRCSRADQRRRD